MNKIAMLGLVSAAALAMAACSPSADKSEGKTEGAAAPAASAALEGPKPGLWRVTTAMDVAGAPAVPAQEVCVTEAKLQDPSQAQQPGAECTSTPFARQGNAMVSTASCKLPGNMKSDSTITVSGDFNSRYTTEVVTKIDPAPTPAMAQTKVTMTAERIGDCPAG